jgi:signal transduction histidine kinase
MTSSKDDESRREPTSSYTSDMLDFGTVFNAIDIPTIVLDASGSVVVWNDAEAALVGVEREAVTSIDSRIGEVLYDGERSTILAEKVLEHPQRAHEVYESVRLAENDYEMLVESSGPVFEDRSTVARSGAEVWFIATPIYEEGELVGVIEFTQNRSRSERRNLEIDRLVTEVSETLESYSQGAFGERATFDIEETIIETEFLDIVDEVNTLGERLQHMEQLEDSNERLHRFATVVSHDLRNPLNVARTHVELLETELDHDSIESIGSALERMNQLIDDVLRLAREGRTVDEPETVSLPDLLQRCASTVETERAAIEIATESHVEADPSRLRELFENLFRNAVEHGSTGSQNPPESDDAVEHGSTSSRTEADDAVEQVTIRVGDLDDGFYVEDNGRGIPEPERESVFEAGYTTAREGTGFGLNIVKAIAEAHGWQVAVTSSDTGGARFEFSGVQTV